MGEFGWAMVFVVIILAAVWQETREEEREHELALKQLELSQKGEQSCDPVEVPVWRTRP